MNSPVRSIRLKCLECSGGSKREIKLCQSVDCALFRYRLGTNPNRKGIGGRSSAITQETTTQVAQVTQEKAL